MHHRTRTRSKTPVIIQNFRVHVGKTTVFNLRTNAQHDFNLSPREAVIAAYAQQHGDFNVTNYEERYGRKVYRSTKAWYLGDWGALSK